MTRPLSRSRSDCSQDAPGSPADPVEQGGTTVAFEEFIRAVSAMSVDRDAEEMTDVFEEAGFKAAGTERRFYGERHSRDAPHVTGSVIELESEAGAISALDWLEDQEALPHELRRAEKRVRR